jgi:hypothetical protein
VSLVIAFFAMGLIGLGSAYVLVHWLGAALGLTDAWLHLEKIASETASSLSDYGSLVGQNLIFGAIVGLVLAVIRYKRVQSNERLRGILEAVVSPTGYNALRIGFSCLVLHLSISMAIAYCLAQLGVALPLPEFIGGTHVAVLAVNNHFIATGGGLGGGGGGGGGPSNDDLLDILVSLIGMIVMVALIAGVVFTVSYWGAGWLAWKKVYWLGIGIKGAAEEVSYGAAVKLGMVFFLVMTGKVGGAPPQVKSLTPAERRKEIDSVWNENDDKLWAMIGRGMLNGSIHAIIYVAAVVAGSAILGLTGS